MSMLMKRFPSQLSPLVRRFSSSNSPTNAAAKGAPISWTSLLISGVIGVGAVSYYQIEKDRLQTLRATKQTTIGKPLLGGPWTLVDTDGKPVTSAEKRGKYLLLYFGFSRCPDICPSELVKVGNILDDMGKKVEDMDTLFISVDPQRDTLTQLKEYGKDFHKNIQYLTGTKEQIAQITKAYRVYFIKANEKDDDEEDYLVDHSTVLYLVSPSGEFLDFFTSSASAPEISKKILEKMNPEDFLPTVTPMDIWKETLAKLGKLMRGAQS